jgi:phage terminase small subunit
MTNTGFNEEGVELIDDTTAPGYPVYAKKKRDPRYALTERELTFTKNVARGLNPTAAARAAGYYAPSNASSRIMKLEKIRKAIAIERAHFVRVNSMSKKKVMDGFLEAINMAKIKSDPIAMVAGWREIAKMCGYFEPVKHQIQIDVSGRVVVQKLQSMSDAELVKLAEGDGTVIDAEFSPIGTENVVDTPLLGTLEEENESEEGNERDEVQRTGRRGWFSGHG